MRSRERGSSSSKRKALRRSPRAFPCSFPASRIFFLFTTSIPPRLGLPFLCPFPFSYFPPSRNHLRFSTGLFGLLPGPMPERSVGSSASSPFRWPSDACSNGEHRRCSIPLRVRRGKNDLFSVQKVDTVAPISPDNFQEGLWNLITFSTHSSPP